MIGYGDCDSGINNTLFLIATVFTGNPRLHPWYDIISTKLLMLLSIIVNAERKLKSLLASHTPPDYIRTGDELTYATK